MPPEPAAGPEGDRAPDREGSAREPGGERERIVPVILPAEKEDSPEVGVPGVDWTRGAVILLALLVPVLVYAAWDAGWLDAGSETSTATAGTVDAAERSARSRFDRMAGSLSEAIQGYEERRADFQRDRIGCAALGTGYDRVDRRFVDLSLLYREERSVLSRDRADRYDRLVEDVNAVNRHYDESGCRTDGP
jgi:hypothetical protein